MCQIWYICDSKKAYYYFINKGEHKYNKDIN